ncbi:hypothetical protein [Gymnodinialimonas sp.]
MVLAVACIATLFLVGTMLRSTVDADAATLTGFQELGGNDTLLAFQDFSFNAEGWTPASTSDRLPGLGPVLGPFGVEPVQRSFAMPANATEAVATFDLHLVGDWAAEGGLQLSLGQDLVLTAELAEGAAPEDITLSVTEPDGVTLAVQTLAVSPRPAEAALPGASTDFVTLHVRLHTTEPGETMVLRLSADVAGEAQWTLDNLAVVTTVGS